MIWAKLKGKKIIVWSHGINLQNTNQPLKNILYYIRQFLADALIIYTPQQKKYIKASHKKLFIANNTLDFNSLPIINESKNELKEKYGYTDKKIILTVGRFFENNRKVSHLISLGRLLDDSYKLLVVGPGLSDSDKEEMTVLNNMNYLGVIYDQKIICELYKMADLFIMPGAIGLSLNQAFYYYTPCIIENVPHGPEAYYFKDGYNGYLYRKGSIEDLYKKTNEMLDNEKYEKFCENAYTTIQTEGSFNKMLEGFIAAIDYVQNEK